MLDRMRSFRKPRWNFRTNWESEIAREVIAKQKIQGRGGVMHAACTQNRFFLKPIGIRDTHGEDLPLASLRKTLVWSHGLAFSRATNTKWHTIWPQEFLPMAEHPKCVQFFRKRYATSMTRRNIPLLTWMQQRRHTLSHFVFQFRSFHWLPRYTSIPGVLSGPVTLKSKLCYGIRNCWDIVETFK